jgi:hypothetical protein
MAAWGLEDEKIYFINEEKLMIERTIDLLIEVILTLWFVGECRVSGEINF